MLAGKIAYYIFLGVSFSRNNYLYHRSTPQLSPAHLCTCVNTRSRDFSRSRWPFDLRHLRNTHTHVHTKTRVISINDTQVIAYLCQQISFEMADEISPHISSGIILGMGSANERRRYIVTPSLIGRGHTQNDSWSLVFSRKPASPTQHPSSVLCIIQSPLLAGTNPLRVRNLRHTPRKISLLLRVGKLCRLHHIFYFYICNNVYVVLFEFHFIFMWITFCFIFLFSI